MYSRKSIRAYQPMTRYLPVEAQRAESAVTPPPDYTGMAFYERGDAADYPEAVIPTMEGASEPPAENEVEGMEPIQPIEPMKPPMEDALSMEPPEEAPLGPEEGSPVPMREEAVPLPQPSPDTNGGAGEGSEPPLLTPAWLRSLTLEDMLLFWLILLLLSGEPEDQIYLLLGLLLFTGR